MVIYTRASLLVTRSFILVHTGGINVDRLMAIIKKMALLMLMLQFNKWKEHLRTIFNCKITPQLLCKQQLDDFLRRKHFHAQDIRQLHR